MTTPSVSSQAARSPRSALDILNVAWPLGMKAIMTHGLIAIDAYMVSPLGEDALAAMGLAEALGGLIVGILFAFSAAAQIRTAQAHGQHNDVSLKTAFGIGLGLNILFAIVGAVGLLLFGPMILAQTAPTPEIAAQAYRYLSVFAVVILLEGGNQVMTAYFNGCGRTKIPFYSYLVIWPVNILVSVVLIHGLWGFPALGVAGAAIGTATAAAVQLGFLSWRFMDFTHGFRGIHGWRNGTLGASIRRHMIFAWPIAMTFISVRASGTVCVLIYAQMSVTDFAAMTLMQPWVHITGMFGMCWAQATGIMVAQLLGERTPSDVMDAFLRLAWKGAMVAAAVVAVAGTSVVLAAPYVYDDLQPATLATLGSFVIVMLLLPFPKGSNAICGQTLRAGGDTVYMMNIFLSAQWLFKVPLTFVLVVWMDVAAVWVFATLAFDELFKFPLFHRRLFKGRWKEMPLDD